MAVDLWDLVKEANDEKEAELKVQQHKEELDEAMAQSTSDFAGKMSWEEKFAEYKRRFNIVNPKTGLRYSVPFLKQSEPGYFWKYADAMELLERDPAAFSRMQNWD